MVPDKTFLLRLVWHPAHFENGELQPAAFDRDDLSGKNGRYISVDREDYILKIATDHTIERQGKKENRHEAFFVRYSCSDVRSAKDEMGNRPFEVTSEPVPEQDGVCPENPAHCAIRNATDNKSKSYINQLRTILVEINSGIKKYDDIFL